MEIINTIHVKGLQNFENQGKILNLFDINIKNDKLWTFVARYRNKGYSIGLQHRVMKK